jgi:FkbM family methyltransferase
MNYRQDKMLFIKCQNKNLDFKLVCEVGVYMPETSNVIDFINNNVQTWLIEPDKNSLDRIYKKFKNKNVTVYPIAIYDYNGILELVQREASTYAKDLSSSPAQINDSYKLNEQDTFKVECKVFNDVDNGKIELLSIDTEGCEWYVLKNMISRPKIISIETHGKYYTNPFITEIKEWVVMNGYKIWYKTKSDTIYYKDGILRLNTVERVKLLLMGLYIHLRKLKKYFH